MAWNEPGNRGESPWGKKRPAATPGSLNETLKAWQDRLKTLFGFGNGSDPDSPAGTLRWLLLLVLVLLWLCTGMFQVEASDKGVIQRFGRFTEVRGDGWGITYPWPIATVTKVDVSHFNSVEYSLRVLTADLNLVQIRSAIQYQNADPVKVLFRVRDLESTLREVGESAIREIVGQVNLDDVLGAARQRVAVDTRDLIQRTLDSYNAGIRVTSVNLTDVQVPEPVLAARRDADKAMEDRDRFQKAAQADANDLPKAKGQAQAQLQDAEAYKAQVVALAEGDVARFNSVYSAYAQAPEVTRQRMYIETIEQIMQQSRKVIVDSRGGAGGNTIYVPLDKLLERAAPARQGTAPAATPAPGGQDLPTVTIDGRARGVR